MSDFAERCNKAIAELTQMARETTIPARAAELLNKTAGVKLALSYYNETEAAKDALLHDVTTYLKGGDLAMTADKLLARIAALAGEAQNAS